MHGSRVRFPPKSQSGNYNENATLIFAIVRPWKQGYKKLWPRGEKVDTASSNLDAEMRAGSIPVGATKSLFEKQPIGFQIAPPPKGPAKRIPG